MLSPDIGTGTARHGHDVYAGYTGMQCRYYCKYIWHLYADGPCVCDFRTVTVSYVVQSSIRRHGLMASYLYTRRKTLFVGTWQITCGLVSQGYLAPGT